MKKLAVAFALILASFALVACGDSSDDTGTTSAETTETQTETGEGAAKGGTAGSAATLDFEAGEGLDYTSDSAESKPGKVAVNFTNPQPLTHDVAIEDAKGKTIAQTELIAEGSDSTTANLKPGEYTFYCTVPGHREGGMEGALTVK
jgi:plastocyanin